MVLSYSGEMPRSLLFGPRRFSPRCLRKNAKKNNVISVREVSVVCALCVVSLAPLVDCSVGRSVGLSVGVCVGVSVGLSDIKRREGTRAPLFLALRPHPHPPSI